MKEGNSFGLGSQVDDDGTKSQYKGSERTHGGSVFQVPAEYGLNVTDAGSDEDAELVRADGLLDPEMIHEAQHVGHHFDPVLLRITALFAFAVAATVIRDELIVLRKFFDSGSQISALAAKG